MKAIRLNDYRGKRVYSFPVEVIHTERQAMGFGLGESGDRTVLRVISHTASEAAHWVREQVLGTPCVEINVYGPKGGRAAHLWQGFDSAIGQLMMACRPTEKQMTLL